MAAPTTLVDLLESLTSSISSALEATPKLAGVTPPKDGISLFDAKNELMLAYLQNLVFLILLKLRQTRKLGSRGKTSPSNLNDLVVKKLVELRLYLDKGVRPLEDKLRYQVDKVLRAAEDAERNAQMTEANKQLQGKKKKSHGSESESGSGSDDEESDEEEPDNVLPDRSAADLMSRPRISAFVRNNAGAGKGPDDEKSKDTSGVYRPPRLNPTVMPTTARQERAERRPMKSATLDEFIADEMSTAPVAEPSIGTTIVAGGRKIKTAADRKLEEERRDFEERNFVRLPKESKKDRAKRAKAEGRSARMNFGGEEWRDLGEGVDRINRLTKGKSSSSGTKALLEKSRKRGLDTTDGPRGSGNSNGVEMGERYQKRLKVLEGGRRDRGRKR